MQREIVPIDTATAADEVELVHLAVIERLDEVPEVMVQVARNAVSGVPERNHLASGKGRRGGTFRAREGAKDIVEGSVFFNDEDDVLDSTGEGRRRVTVRKALGLLGLPGRLWLSSLEWVPSASWAGALQAKNEIAVKIRSAAKRNRRQSLGESSSTRRRFIVPQPQAHVRLSP